MKIKLSLAAIAIILSPAAAFAMGCQGADHASQQATMSCAEGMTFDVEANTCVAEVTG